MISNGKRGNITWIKQAAELNGKLKALSFRINKTDKLINKADKQALEIQRTSIATISSIVNRLKETIEEKKFAKGESEEQIQEWGAETELLLAEAGQQIRRIAGKLTEMSSTEQKAIYLMEQKKKLQFEKLLTEQKLLQEQEATERIHAEKLAYEKEKMKLDLEY